MIGSYGFLDGDEGRVNPKTGTTDQLQVPNRINILSVLHIYNYSESIDGKLQGPSPVMIAKLALLQSVLSKCISDNRKESFAIMIQNPLYLFSGYRL